MGAKSCVEDRLEAVEQGVGHPPPVSVGKRAADAQGLDQLHRVAAQEAGAHPAPNRLVDTATKSATSG